jgi:hypothetical protein
VDYATNIFPIEKVDFQLKTAKNYAAIFHKLAFCNRKKQLIKRVPNENGLLHFKKNATKYGL